MDVLIKKIKQGDKVSQTKLIEMYYDEIYLYVLKLTMNKDLSFDLTQEIFIRVLKKIHTFWYNGEKIKNWIYKIAHNYVMSYFKILKKEGYYTDYIDFIPDQLNIEDDLIRKEDKNKLIEVINHLETIYKDIIIFRYYHEFSIKDISLILKLNENTVKTRITRGLEILKNELERGDLDVRIR